MELFQHPQFGDITVVMSEDGKPLFKGNDVARALGYKIVEKAVRSYCKAPSILDAPSAGGIQKTKFIPEHDVYRLVMRSKLPEAERFQDWVVEEVLPCIRQTGGYMTDSLEDKLIDNPDLLIRLATEIKQKKAELREMQAKEKQNLRTIAKQKETIALMSRKVSYVDMVLSCPKLICTTQIAQDYGMSAVKFNSILSNLQIQYKMNRQWILYAQYKDCGYVQSATTITESGKTVMWTYWTQTGRLFLYEMLKKHGYLPVMERKEMFQSIAEDICVDDWYESTEVSRIEREIGMNRLQIPEQIT